MDLLENKQKPLLTIEVIRNGKLLPNYSVYFDQHPEIWENEYPSKSEFDNIYRQYQDSGDKYKLVISEKGITPVLLIQE